jgi:hypothetical protein
MYISYIILEIPSGDYFGQAEPQSKKEVLRTEEIHRRSIYVNIKKVEKSLGIKYLSL